MKKNIFVLIAICLLSILFLIPMQAATLTGSGMPILITEVSAMPSQTQDFGQLVEIYNNTDAELDLYDYEFDVTTSRSADLTVQMATDKCKGGFFASAEKGKVVLKTGEVAVIWLVTDSAQGKFTEADVRTIMGNIPAGTKIVRVDTTDKNVSYGDVPYVDRAAACYLMANLRGCYADGGKNADLAGAYVRIYGQTGQGKSQLYGDIGSQTQTRWQADLTATTGTADSNVACAFGKVHATQSTILVNAYIPVAETTTGSGTTKAPETTKAPTTAPKTGDATLIFLFIVTVMVLTVTLMRRTVRR